MRSRAAWARGKLHRMLVRIQDNPFSSEEVLQMQRELDALEDRVEELGEVAARERLDVDALDSVWRRGLLWLVGELEQRELKERREYEEALAAVLAEGEKTARLRARIEALGPEPAFSDAQVAKVLRAVNPADFRRFGSRLGKELSLLREGLDVAQDVWWLERQTERTYQVVRKGRRRSSMVGRLKRLERGLRSLGLEPDAKEVSGLTTLYEGEDPALVKHRRQRALRLLKEVRQSLRRVREARQLGVSVRLTHVVRDVQLPAWP